MSKWIQYLLCSLFVGLVAVGYLWGGDFVDQDTANRLRLLCDGFSVPGVLLLCAGALMWTSAKGALNGLGYSLRMALRALVPGRRSGKQERYGDFVSRKRAASARCSSLLISGAVSIGISLCFLALYYGST